MPGRLDRSFSKTDDAREKTDLRDSELGLAFVLSLSPRSFQWENGGSVEVAREIAEEIEEPATETVTETRERIDVVDGRAVRRLETVAVERPFVDLLPLVDEAGAPVLDDQGRSSTPTINYGHVLTALSIVIAGTGAYYGMSSELHNVDQRVAKIEVTLQQLSNVMVLTERQDDERLIAIERRVDRLEQMSSRNHP